MSHRNILATVALATLSTCLLSACAGKPAAPVITGLPPVAVTATAETAPVGTANADAADDPAIWRNEADPAASLIVATDKKAGLYVYGLDGARRGFADAGLVNNVDLIGDVVIASDRNDRARAHLALYRLDPAAASLTRIARVPVAAGEAYGLCIDSTRSTAARVALALVMKDGTVIGGSVGSDGGAASFAEAWRHKLPTQAEGCVFDGDRLFVGEEDAGIWQIVPAAGAGAAPAATMVAPIDNQRLVADVEGLAIITDTSGRYLIGSSQGDNSYAVWRLPADGSLAYIGRFAIRAGSVGATSETDGIAAMGGGFGAAYPDGLFIAQDGDNRPAAQNFKLVSWAGIAAALGLR